MKSLFRSHQGRGTHSLTRSCIYLVRAGPSREIKTLIPPELHIHTRMEILLPFLQVFSQGFVTLLGEAYFQISPFLNAAGETN